MLIPAILFIAFFLMDTFVTNTGISLGYKEGNPIVVWLWSVFGYGNLLLRPSYIFFITFSAYLISRKSFKFSLVFLYSFAVGHLFGFLSWIEPNLLNICTAGLYYLLPEISIYIIVLFASIYGFILTSLQLRFQH